jgi:putative SbcD/Mre11-related phosphoesterase
MKHTRLELVPGIVLDARRAVYLEGESVLAVADLHLGYAWTHRARGQILPLSAPDDTAERLLGLLQDYRPKTLVLLGDIVHGLAPDAKFRGELTELLGVLRSRAKLVLIAGNHDRDLAKFTDAALVKDLCVGPHLLLHGDSQDEKKATAKLSAIREAGGWVMMGHEHPAVVVSDGVAHSARVPCFLAGDGLLVLPAFSNWAAGGNVRSGDYLSAYVKVAEPGRAFAILAGKILPVKV